MAGCVAAALALGGCDDMMARRDGISPDAGNAVAANAALQIIDPWPSPAFDPRAASDGTRLASAMERYRSGGPIAPPDNAGKTTPVVFSPVSTGAQ
jgi:hypothetical protein